MTDERRKEVVNQVVRLVCERCPGMRVSRGRIVEAMKDVDSYFQDCARDDALMELLIDEIKNRLARIRK